MLATFGMTSADCVSGSAKHGVLSEFRRGRPNSGGVRPTLVWS